MEIEHIKQFICIAKTNNITKASTIMQIAQPALSRTIKNFEKELNCRLFDRVGRNIILNENGRIFLKRALVILNEIEDIKTELNESNKVLKKDIVINMQIATKTLPKILADFRAIHPEIKIFITQEEGVGDIQIKGSSELIQTSNNILLLKEPLLLAVPLNHPLSNAPQISLKDVSFDDFIAISRKKNLGKLSYEYCLKAGFNPNIIIESDIPSVIFDLVSLGLGISIVPAVSWGSISEKNIKLIPIAEEFAQRYYYVSWDSRKYLSMAARFFIEYLDSYFKNSPK